MLTTGPGRDDPTDPSAGLKSGASPDPRTGPSAADLAVVIPTVGRWDILERTLGGLRAQSTLGFEVIVVSDGAGPPPSGLTLPGGARFITQRAAGPGAARNRGVAETDRSLVLFLGDDMIPVPDLVGTHLATHGRHPGPDAAVLGRVDWHPEVIGNRLNQWLDTSGTQFDYSNIERERAGAGSVDYDVGFGRFYSCNVSLKRSLFDSVGGFDESFIFYYEDLDLAWRLSDKGLRLLYAPTALTLHLHGYDWAGIENRFRGIALGEKLMAREHPDFEPFFLQRITSAVAHRSLPQPWAGRVERLIGATLARASERIPSRRTGLVAKARAMTDTAYHRRLAGSFLQAWSSADEVCELRDYLGEEFRPELLIHHEEEADKEADGAPDESTFYRTSRVYLYDLTAFAMGPTKQPYLSELTRHVTPGGRILDYGCGIGSDGLRLSAMGYDVSFADFDNPSTRYLRWRLDHRGLKSSVYDIDVDDIPSDFDAVYCLDVIEHVPDPHAFLSRLESLGRLVMVNFLEPEPGDTHLHRDLDVAGLVGRAERHGLLSYRVHHGRSHLVVYRSTDAARGWSSKAARWEGQARHRLSRVGDRAARALDQARPAGDRLRALARRAKP